MRHTHLVQILFLAVVALVMIAGCAPSSDEEPTPVPTPTAVVQEETPIATAASPTPVAPSATPVVATATSVAAVTDTPISTEVPATATATAIPPTPVPPLPTNTPVPTATRVPPTPTVMQIADWRGEYFDNPGLQGGADLVRNDRVVDFDLGAGERPAPGIPAENWSARWSRQWTFDPGNYRFQLLVDDGARLWVNDGLLIDAWEDGALREFAANLYLSGQASIRLEYYNRFGPGRARLNWERVTDYAEWKGSYYPGRDLSGAPRFERNDPAIDFNWGANSPRHDIPTENFAVRWTRRLQLTQGGTYRFLVVSDDGARLWVDGQLIIDTWRDGYTTDEATITLAAGGHDVRLEYYERLGGAMIRLTWSLIPATATPTATVAPPTRTPTTTVVPPTATPTATPTAITPPPGRPAIRLQPQAGALGQTITVVGEGWPAGGQVDIVVGVSGQDLASFFKVGEAVAGPDGRFQAQITVPSARQWQGASVLQVIARTRDQSIVAQATFNVEARGEAEGRSVPFGRIPTNEPRFVLQRPTFLALDSAQAWATHFGQEPPAANPPVNWQEEYVLGAFVAPQGAEAGVRVESIMVQGSRAIIRLAAPAMAEGNAFSGVLVRVSRSALGIGGQPTFTFVDARGQVVASGQPGATPLSLSLQRQAPRSEVPEAAGTPAADLVPGIESMPEEAPEALAAPAPEVAPEVGAALAPEVAPEEEVPPAPAGEVPGEEVLPEAAVGQGAETQEQAKEVTWQQSAIAWMALLAWGVFVVLLVAGVFMVLRRAMRQS